VRRGASQMQSCQLKTLLEIDGKISSVCFKETSHRVSRKSQRGSFRSDLHRNLALQVKPQPAGTLLLLLPLPLNSRSCEARRFLVPTGFPPKIA